MASAPAFAATPRFSSIIASATLDTSLTAPTNVGIIITGVAAGTKVEEVTMQALGTTAAGVINLFAYDTTTYNLIDQWLVPAVTSSTILKAWRSSRQYTNLILPSASWSLRFTVTVSGLQSLIKASAAGGDF
jgi:hypothetical protein